MKIKDWQNNEIDEPALQDMVKVWHITPHQDSAFTECVVMGWAEMLDIVKDTAELKLEGFDDVELVDGLKMEIKLVEMSYQDYLDCFEN